MAVRSFEDEVRRIAQGLRNIPQTLEAAGDLIANEVKANIDNSRQAGEHRAIETLDFGPGSEMDPISSYTRKKREEQGIVGTKPLKATGRLYRSIGTRRRGFTVRVGPKSAAMRDRLWKMMGTQKTGIESTDLGKAIPPRNPLGYSPATRKKILAMFEDSLGVRGKGVTVIKREVRIR